MKTALKHMLGPRLLGLIKSCMGRQPNAGLTPPPQPTHTRRRYVSGTDNEIDRLSEVTIGDTLREKWKEVPTSAPEGGRVYSADLLKMDDQSLLKYWRGLEAAGCTSESRGWYQLLYRQSFKDWKILEVGSGLGFDGTYFLRQGSRWIFADIVEDNLRVIERICRLLGVRDRADFLFIESPASFDSLPCDFDVIWCNGSLINISFNSAREECSHILPHLKRGGRWIELAYPYERWVREGSKPFSEWGKLTDGERTPWVEWYDIDKLKQRLFPARLGTVLNLSLTSGAMNWMDMVLESDIASDSRTLGAVNVDEGIDLTTLEWEFHPHIRPQQTEEGLQFTTLPQMWSTAGHLNISSQIRELIPTGLERELSVVVELECSVESGTLGFTISDKDLAPLGSERMTTATTHPQRVIVPVSKVERAETLVVRNTDGAGESSVTIHRARLRMVRSVC